MRFYMHAKIDPCVVKRDREKKLNMMTTPIDHRKCAVQVRINGDIIGTYGSYPGSTFNSLGVEADGVKFVVLESVGIDEDEWISLLEVSITVPFRGCTLHKHVVSCTNLAHQKTPSKRVGSETNRSRNRYSWRIYDTDEAMYVPPSVNHGGLRSHFETP